MTSRLNDRRSSPPPPTSPSDRGHVDVTLSLTLPSRLYCALSSTVVCRSSQGGYLYHIFRQCSVATRNVTHASLSVDIVKFQAHLVQTRRGASGIQPLRIRTRSPRLSFARHGAVTVTALRFTSSRPSRPYHSINREISRNPAPTDRQCRRTGTPGRTPRTSSTCVTTAVAACDGVCTKHSIVTSTASLTRSITTQCSVTPFCACSIWLPEFRIRSWWRQHCASRGSCWFTHTHPP